jgi:hypothetical protein
VEAINFPMCLIVGVAKPSLELREHSSMTEGPIYICRRRVRRHVPVHIVMGVLWIGPSDTLPTQANLARAIDSSRIGGLICESNHTSLYVFVSTAVVVLLANRVDSRFCCSTYLLFLYCIRQTEIRTNCGCCSCFGISI